MRKDDHLMFENYVDGMTKRKSELAGNIMDIVKYGIPSKEQFIKIRQQLHDKVREIKERGTEATAEEKAAGHEMIAQIRAYRSQHPMDPLPFTPEQQVFDRQTDNAEDAENTQPADVSNEIRIKLGQAYNIVKGLIALLDNTPTGQTPYNEMAITHLVNLQEDLKELTMILQDRMLKQSENAEDRSVQAGGAIEDITDIQKQSMDLLKQHGFHVNKVSNAHAEQQGGPVVYMGKKTGMMHQVAEVDPQGMINEETPEEYLANHVHAEDAEGRSNAQHAAIAISLQKAGKKPS